MSSILYSFWWLYFIAFVVGSLLPSQNVKKRIFIAIITAFLSLMPMALLILFVSGPGAGFVGAGALAIGMFVSFLSTGFAAGVFCRSKLAQGQKIKAFLFSLVLIPLPLSLGYGAQLSENKVEQDKLNTLNIFWQKRAEVKLGDTTFSLPLSPRQHWVYQNGKGQFVGGNFQNRRSREAINIRLENGPPVVTLKLLVIKPVDPPCDQHMKNFDKISSQLRNFCIGTRLPTITSWCDLNPDLTLSLWCDTGQDARRYRVNFYVGESSTSNIKDGDCLRGVCYFQMDITDQVKATISIDKKESTANEKDGRNYAKKLWSELIADQG